jgi:hypothetical protein
VLEYDRAHVIVVEHAFATHAGAPRPGPVAGVRYEVAASAVR